MRVLERHALQATQTAGGDVTFFTGRQDEQHLLSLQVLWQRAVTPRELPC
jgi:hypothetical protein